MPVSGILKSMVEHLESLQCHLNEVENSIENITSQHSEAMDLLVSIVKYAVYGRAHNTSISWHNLTSAKAACIVLGAIIDRE
jgi:DNA anti-recombination protein RmuC